MTQNEHDHRDDDVSGRLRSLGARTRDLQASPALRRRLVDVAEGSPAFSGAILRFALPSLVFASLAAGGLVALDRGRGGADGFDDDLALAATMTMEVAP